MFDPRIKIKRTIVILDTVVSLVAAFFLLGFFIAFANMPLVGVVVCILMIVMAIFGYLVLDHALGLSGREVVVYSKGVQFPVTRFSRIFHVRTFVPKGEVRSVVLNRGSVAQQQKGVPLGVEEIGSLQFRMEKSMYTTSERRYREVKAAAESIVKEWGIDVQGLSAPQDRNVTYEAPVMAQGSNFCTGCGSKKEDGTNFCTACGKRFE